MAYCAREAFHDANGSAAWITRRLRPLSAKVQLATQWPFGLPESISSPEPFTPCG